MKTKIKKLLLIGITFLFSGIALIAQNGNPFWSMPSKYYQAGSLFNLPTASPGYTAAATTVPSNMYCDAAGNPLFFKAEGSLFNRYGHLISYLNHTITPSGGGTPVQADVEGWSKVCIVPHPDSCTKYYVFSEFEYTLSNDYSQSCGYSGGYGTGGLHRPVYAQIDMAQQTPNYTGEYGKNIYAPSPTSTLTTKDLYLSTSTAASNIASLGCSPYPGDISYACTRLLAGSYRFLFVNNGLEIIVYKVDVNGITFLYNYYLGTLSGGYGGGGVNELGFNLTETEVYEDSLNSRIKVALVGSQNLLWNTSGVDLMIMDFNFTTGAYISLPLPTAKNICLSGRCGNPNLSSDSVIYAHGIEFSPNGKWVYALHRPSATHPTVLHAFSYSTPATFYSVTPSGVTMGDFRYSQMEIGTDTALYFIGQNGSSNPRMAKITSPSAPWNAGTNFTNSVVTLAGYGNSTTDRAGYMFFLPDQIDHQNYNAVLNANSACCIQFNTYDKMTYTTSTSFGGGSYNQVWKPNTSTATPNNPIALSTNLTSTVTIGEELRIKMGYTVTIQNMTLKFSPVATLVVDGSNGVTNSAKLILKKCTLDVDPRCVQKMWPGVRVWGNTAYPRSNSSQGYFVVDSLSVITNARLGVELGYNSFDVTYDASVVPAPTNSTTAGGGQLLCTNSSFINNERGIYFDTYSGVGGVCSIQTTTFVTNATLIQSGVSPRYFIGLHNYTPNALIQGTNMTCSSSLPAYYLKDTGIYSLNSMYSLDKFTTGSVRSVISNMLYGVRSSNTSGSNTISLKSSNFLNNVVGAYLGRINNATISTQDTFKIYNTSGSGGNCTGLYLDNCTGYWVQDNHFTRYASGIKNLYGIVVYNSGPSANAVFRNTFTNLYKGSQAQYINYTSSGQIANGTGLLYLCNIFSSVTAGDIYVPARTENTNVGAPYTCSPCYRSGIAYAQGAAGSASGGNRSTADNQFSHAGKDFWMGVNGSDSAYTSSYVYYCPTSTVSTCSNGGYTSVWKPDPARSNNYLSSPWYLASSPDCATGGNGHREMNPLESALSDIAVSRTQYDSLQILYNASNNDYALNVAMAVAFTNWQLAVDQAVRIYLEDHTDSSNALAYNLMKVKANALPARVRLEAGVNTHDSAYAVQALQQVIASEGQSNYVKIYTILLQNLSKTPQEIMANVANANVIKAVGADSGEITAYVTAHMILGSVGLSHYEPYIQENGAASDSAFARRGNASSLDLFENTLSSKPNPFKENATIKAIVASKTDNAYVLITDLLGKEIGRYKLHQGENEITFNPSETSQQVFFCTLLIDGMKVKTNKMVLVK